MEVNCHIWTLVDFGKGNVEIRCTQMGDHDDHRCEVVIETDEVVSMEEDLPVERHNIFERRAG